MISTLGKSLRIAAPEFFVDPAFVAWLNNGERKMTWHALGAAPGDWSDVVVFVDPSLSGEGTDANMPDHIWGIIIDACRDSFEPSSEQDPADPSIAVWLQNSEMPY